MKKAAKILAFVAIATSGAVFALDDDTLDAAIGGAIGGAAGAAIGNEVGGRDGAIIGGGIGGATGAAISTDGDEDRHESDEHYGDSVGHKHDNKGDFCPPGQAKKGRC